MDKKILLLILLNLLLFLMLYVTRRKKWLGRIVLFFAFFLFFLTAWELVYRAFINKESYYTGDLKSGFYKYDTTMGYVMGKTGRLNAIKKIRNDVLYEKTYTVIPDSVISHVNFNRRVGFRDTDTAREIVFLGCSFTFGEGLEDTASLPYKTGKLAGISTVNLGCNGYGVHQVYQLFMDKYADQPDNNRIFVYSFLYDHILRANGIYEWNLDGPFFKTVGDSVVRSGSIARNSKTRTSKYIHYISLLGTLSFLENLLTNIDIKNRVKNLSQADYDRCFSILQEMAKEIQRTGGKLIIIDWDKNNWANNTANDLPVEMMENSISKLTDLDVKVIQVSSVIELSNNTYFIPNDGHPSELANDKLASCLSGVIETYFQE